MLDNNDIQKLIKAQKEVFATKEDIENLIDIVATKIEVEQGFDKIGGRFEKIDKKIEKIATKEDMKILGKKLDLLSEDLKKNNNLDTRVDYIENVLAIKK